MTLYELLERLPLTHDEGVAYALVFAASLLPELEAVQSITLSQHKAGPVALIDGRYMLGADLLSEVGEEGLYAAGFNALDPQVFQQIELIPFEDGVALLPEPVEELTIAS